MSIDEAKLNEFVGRFAGDLGAVTHAATVLVGDRLGLYRAMGDSRWVTPAELAARTETEERYLAEWLAAQAASGYTEYDPETGRFRLTEEQAFALTDENNPFFAPGGLQVAASTIKDVELIAEAFRTGRGVAWGEQAGATVADVGCGYGASTLPMGQVYPNASFVGCDSHGPSIDAARKAEAKAGVADRCTFEVASAKDYTGSGYDLVTFFDCLHDMGDPVGAAAHVRICTPGSRSQEVGAALGAQASEARIRDVTERGGFTRFRRAGETPFNLVLEARP